MKEYTGKRSGTITRRILALAAATGVAAAMAAGATAANGGQQSPGGGFAPGFGGSFGPGFGGGFGPGYGSGFGPGSGGGVPGEPSSGSGTVSSASGSPANVAGIAAKVAPALVNIDSTLGYQSEGGAGTGIVIGSSGEVLTNNHVVEGGTKITATDVGNGKTYTVKVLGYDPSHDVALVQLHGASGLKTATFGDSSKLNAGQGVVGIGNAGGVGGKPSAAGGSITRLHASVTASDDLASSTETLTGMIETNAPIQPGDSGGPLVDSQGRVIGMDTAGSAGFSFDSTATQAFAIPIDEALSIVRQIESGKGSTTVHVGDTAFLGVQVSTAAALPGDGAGASPGFGGVVVPGFGGGVVEPGYGGEGGSAPASGLYVSGVVSDGPAQKAGIEVGDTITSLGGKTVRSQSGVLGVLFVHHPGDRIEIGWTDTSGASRTATITLARGPAQ